MTFSAVMLLSLSSVAVGNPEAQSWASIGEPISFEEWQKTINANFPHLWSYAEACASTVAVLLIKDTQPLAPVLQRAPSGGKTTTLDFFRGFPHSHADLTAKNPRKNLQLQTKQVAGKTFRQMRKKAIHKLGNPELRKIDFYTFRYWQATATYRKYGDFGKVMVLHGHKSLRYVLLYAQLSETYDFNTGYIFKEATNRHEAKRLIEAGFEYVMEKDGFSLFKKLK